MDKKSREKVMASGFTIIRTDDMPTPRIKCLVSHMSWKTLEGDFKNKTERDRRFKELMKQDDIITD